MECNTDHCHQKRQKKSDKHKLTRSFICLLHVFVSKILRTDDRTSSRQGQKRFHNQDIDCVHQGYRRNSRRPDIADDQRVHRPHKRIQKLIQSQWNQQRSQLPVGKQMLFLLFFHCGKLPLFFLYQFISGKHFRQDCSVVLLLPFPEKKHIP